MITINVYPESQSASIADRDMWAQRALKAEAELAKIQGDDNEWEYAVQLLDDGRWQTTGWDDLANAVRHFPEADFRAVRRPKPTQWEVVPESSEATS